MSTLEMYAHDAGYALLVDETEFRYLVTSDDKPFAYFLNPAVYSTGTAFMRWDEATKAWVVEDQHDLQYLDDRYGVGSNYLSDHYGKQPLGSNLPGVFVKLDAAGELADANVESLKLSKAYTGGTVVPYLVIKVYEQRLASYTYYTWLGSPLGDGTGNTVSASGYLALTKESLIDTMAAALDTALSTGGAIHTAYKEFTGLDIVVDYDAGDNTLTLSGMNSFDGYELKGERAGEITSGHLQNAEIVIPGLTRIVGHEYYGFKPMRGMYTVFAPEKLNDLMVAIEGIIADDVSLAALSAAQKEQLRDQLGYRWSDFFRGQDQEFVVENLDGTTSTIRANVFVAALGSQLVAPTVTVYNEDGSEQVYVGQPVNLTDSFSHVDETFHTAKPTARRFITGPYGAQGIVNEDGTITWLSDAYSV